MMKVYGCPRTRSTRVTWALEEAGAAYEFVRVDLARGDARQPDFLAVNPGGKVPALVDGDLVLTESCAIVTYIGERYPASGLVPPAPADRAHCFQWMAFVISELEQPLWTLAKHRFALPEHLRLAAIAPTAQWEFARAAAVLAQHLQARDYLVGGELTGADILAAQTLGWARAYEVPLGSPVLEAYADRLLDRPALAAARARESA